MIWPASATQSAKQHSLDRAHLSDFAISKCRERRTAVQAGGNVGLWPIHMAKKFERVITFEPDPIMFDCLLENVFAFPNIQTHMTALGSERKHCSIKHRGLGSHRVIEGSEITMMPLDDLGLTDVDLIQFDVEGYEMECLMGALFTIDASRPIIQLELRDFTKKYGSSDEEVRALLRSRGYGEIGTAPGSDYIFGPT